MTSGITERVRQRFAAEGVEATPAAVVAAVREEPAAAVLGDTTVLRLAGRVLDQLVGAGPLAPLLADQAVTDVLVNGVEVWVDRGAGLERAAVEIGSTDDVRRLAQRLAAACGRRLDDGQPYADARLPDGTRLHAVLPPVAATGPYLSLRTFRQRPFTLDDLVGHGTIPADVAPVLVAVVAARLAYLVTGGTGSGKTTLLGTLLGLVPATERIVLVEDAAELRPVHPHVVALQARTSNVEGAGAVGLTDLVRQALRMRPDRLVIGECRGAEIVDLLGALNTGHDGGAGTLHANAPADVPARLEALGMLGGLPRAALHAQVLAALQVVLQVRRTAAGRVLESVSVLLPAGHERLVTVVPAWRRGSGAGPAAEALAQLLTTRGVPVPAVLTSSGTTPPTPSRRPPAAPPSRGPAVPSSRVPAVLPSRGAAASSSRGAAALPSRGAAAPEAVVASSRPAPAAATSASASRPTGRARPAASQVVAVPIPARQPTASNDTGLTAPSTALASGRGSAWADLLSSSAAEPSGEDLPKRASTDPSRAAESDPAVRRSWSTRGASSVDQSGGRLKALAPAGTVERPHDGFAALSSLEPLARNADPAASNSSVLGGRFVPGAADKPAVADHAAGRLPGAAGDAARGGASSGASAVGRPGSWASGTAAVRSARSSRLASNWSDRPRQEPPADGWNPS